MTEHRHPRCITPASGTSADQLEQKEQARRNAYVELDKVRLVLGDVVSRCVTIADEAFGLGPVEPIEATLTRIERGIFEQHKRNSELEVLVNELRCGDLHAFFDDELSAERTAAFREHLTTCERCRDQHGGLMQERMTTSWAPEQCTAAIACPREDCGAARGERCKTDRPLHAERWDAWKAAGLQR